MNPLTLDAPWAQPDSAASREPMGLRWLGYGLLAVAVILGAVLRWRCWAPVTSDEVAIIKPFSGMTYHFFTDQEAARNPPLFSLLFSFLEVPSRIATAGRLFSATCSLMAAVPAFFAGRVLSRGSSLAGALAGALVALNPPLAMEGVTFRAYGSFALAESARLALLCVLLQETHPETLVRSRLAFVWLTALLPWIHYAAFPILTLEAALLLLFVRPARALLKAHVIAAITSVPLVWMILSSDNRPEATGNPLDWTSRFWLGGAFRLGGGAFRQGGDPWVTVAVLAPLVLAGMMFARAPATRAMLAHSLAVLGAAWWLSAHVFVRPAVAALGAPSLGIWLVALAYAAPGWFARIALLSVAVVFATGYPTQFHPDGQPNYIPLSPARAMAAFAHDVLQSEEPTTWHVFHGWDMTVLDFHFKAEGAQVHSCVVSAPDGNQLGCIEVGAKRFIEVKDIDQAPSGKLVTFGCDNKKTRCRLVGGEPCALIYECP